MATTLGCSKCHTLLAHDGCVKDRWPAVCPKCGNTGSFQSWAGSSTWEKAQAEEFAKQPSHSQPDRLADWAKQPQQERFFIAPT